MKNLGAVLVARGITIYRLAKLSGHSTSTLYGILHGKTQDPAYHTVKKLAEVLQVAPEDFFLDSFNSKQLQLLKVQNPTLEQTP